MGKTFLLSMVAVGALLLGALYMCLQAFVLYHAYLRFGYAGAIAVAFLILAVEVIAKAATK